MLRPRVAVIGAGPWGRKIISGLDRLAEAQLVSVSSSNVDTRSLVPGDCEIVPQWRSLLNRKIVDGVVIATPPRLHAEMALASLDAGIGVLIEKPMCLTTPQANAIVSLARKKESIVHVNHIDLQNAAWIGLRENIEIIGPIRSIKGVIGGNNAHGDNAAPHWEYGPHFIACCLNLMRGMPDLVVSHWTDMARSSGMDSQSGERLVEVLLQFGDVTARILAGGNMPRKARRLSVHGTIGTLIYDDCAADKLTLQASSGDVSKIPVAPTMPLENVLRRFACALQRPNEADTGDAMLGQHVVEILCQCDDQLMM